MGKSKFKKPISCNIEVETYEEVNKLIEEGNIKNSFEIKTMSDAVRYGLKLLIEKNEKYGLKNVEVENTFKIIRTQISIVLQLTKEHDTNLSKINQKITRYFEYLENSNNSKPGAKSPSEDPDINKRTYTQEFNKLFDNYNQIPFCGNIVDCKCEQFDAFSEKIRTLKEEQQIYWITPEESFALSKSLILQLQKHDRIIAVSIIGDGEWADTAYWREYKEVQLKALEAGAEIERILYPKDDNDLNVTSMSKFIPSDKMICYSTTDEKKIPDNTPDDIKDLFNQGFMLINKKSTNEMMAVIDHFGDDKSEKNPFKINYSYRTDVLFDVEKLTRIEKYFDEIKVKLKPTK
jgi:hypothetical protein